MMVHTGPSFPLPEDATLAKNEYGKDHEDQQKKYPRSSAKLTGQ